MLVVCDFAVVLHAGFIGADVELKTLQSNATSKQSSITNTTVLWKCVLELSCIG